MPGNAFAEGITHSVHELELTTGSFEIIVRNRVQGPPNAYVNGFQISAVPEPASIICYTLATALLIARRRRKM